MNADPTERQIQNAIVLWLNLHGIKAWANDTVGIWDAKRGVYRRNTRRLRGVSDILGILPGGRFLAIEVKRRPSDNPSRDQELFIAEIVERGGVAFVARSIEDVEKALEGVISHYRRNTHTQGDMA